MSLDKAMQNLKFDIRLVEFNLRTGQLSKEELQKHMSTLPDNANNAEKIEIEDGTNGAVADESH